MIKKSISIILILILLCMGTTKVIAASVSELQDEKDKVEEQKEEVAEEKKSLMDEISELNTNISKYEREIEKLNNEIDSLENSINKKEKEIEELKDEIESKKDLLIKRLVAMYEAGQTTYLDVLLASDNISNLISNYYRIEEIAEADQTVINAIITKQEESEEKKQELEKEKKKINESKKEVEEKNESLQVAKASKQSKVSDLSAEEKELQAQIDEFEEQIEEAKRQSAQNDNNYHYEGSFEGDLSWPISSNSYGYNCITSFFGNRPAPLPGASTNHGAVDIGVAYVPVYSAADGVIVSAGWMSGYGNYIEIDHGNGYYTAYGHLDSFNVSPGQTVSRGQQIAISGNTGNSTGPHLHFEVYIGGLGLECRVDPLQYTSHPAIY